MSRDLKSWLLLILLACIWGSSFILMKRGMISLDGSPIFSDTQVGALRMSIAGLVMLPFGWMARKKITSMKQVLSLLVVGIFGNFFPAFLFTFAETKLSSGLAGMLNSFTPFFTLLIGWMIFKQGLKWQQVIGLVIAFGGIVLLVGLGDTTTSQEDFIYIGAIMLATVMYGTSLNTIKHILSAFKSWEITALAFSLVAIPAWLSSYFTGTFEVISTNKYALEGLGFITILSVVGTCLALVIFNRIIALKSAVFASSVTYVIPIVAVLMGVMFLKETFHLLQLAGMLVVISGVFIANTARSK
ncbi:MAG: EamA family transporter [Fluviicola sp.]|nr:EamA family transporter [Fluviicola sp.]